MRQLIFLLLFVIFTKFGDLWNIININVRHINDKTTKNICVLVHLFLNIIKVIYLKDAHCCEENVAWV